MATRDEEALDRLEVHCDRARNQQHHLIPDLDPLETRHGRIDKDLARLPVRRREGDDALVVVNGGDRVGDLYGRAIGVAVRREQQD